MERVSYNEILKWLKQQPKLPIIVPTLGFNSSISVNLSNNNTTFIVTGSTGKKKEIDQPFWDAEMNTMEAALGKRKCITTTYSSAGNGHPYLWAPGLIAICREYWRQKANFQCPFLTCKKHNQC